MWRDQGIVPDIRPAIFLNARRALIVHLRQVQQKFPVRLRNRNILAAVVRLCGWVQWKPFITGRGGTGAAEGRRRKRWKSWYMFYLSPAMRRRKEKGIQTPCSRDVSRGVEIKHGDARNTCAIVEIHWGGPRGDALISTPAPA